MQHATVVLAGVVLIGSLTSWAAGQEEAHVSWDPIHGSNWTDSDGWGLDSECGLFAQNNMRLSCQGEAVPRWFATVPSGVGPTLERRVELVGFSALTSFYIQQGGSLEVQEELNLGDGNDENGSPSVLGAGGLLVSERSCVVREDTQFMIPQVVNAGNWVFESRADQAGLSPNTEFRNEPGAVLTFEGDASLINGQLLRNDAKFTKSGGGHTIIDADYIQEATGRLEVIDGSIAEFRRDFIVDGIITVGPEATLWVHSGASQYSIPAEVHSQGAIDIEVQDELDISGVFESTGSTGVWRGNVHFPANTRTGSLTIAGGNLTRVNGQITVTTRLEWRDGHVHSSTLDLMGFGVIGSDSGTPFLEESTLVVHPGAEATIVGNRLVGVGSTTLVNNGFVFLGGTAFLASNDAAPTLINGDLLAKVEAGASWIAWTLENRGAFIVASGTLFLVGPCTQTAGETYVINDGILYIANEANMIQCSAGVLGGNGRVEGGGTIEMTGTAVLSPGKSDEAPGDLTVDNDIDLGPSTTSVFHIAGAAPGEWDTVTAIGYRVITAGGTIAPVLIGGFESAISPSDSFVVASSQIRPIMGQFANAPSGGWVDVDDAEGRRVGLLRVYYGPDSVYAPNLVVVTEFRRSDPPPCDEDVNGSGGVDFDDVLAILAAWGPCPDPPDPCPADVDGDGVVAFGDLLAVLGGWGPCE